MFRITAVLALLGLVVLTGFAIYLGETEGLVRILESIGQTFTAITAD